VLAAIRKRHATLFPLVVYIASRIAFLGATAVGPKLIQPEPLLRHFIIRWDAVYYLSIATDGYPHGSALVSEHAFFPLYPLVVRVVNVLLPGDAFGAALTVSFVAGAVATVLLWRFARRIGDAAIADRTVILFCLFPGTIVFGWPYADALLIALMCGSLVLLAEGHWFVAAVVAAGASATRPSGLVLAVACAWVAYERIDGTRVRKVLGAGGAAALAASGFVAFMLWLWNHTGNALQWFDVERTVFNEGRPWKRLPPVFLDTVRGGPDFGRSIVIAFTGLALVVLVVGLTARQPGWAKAVTALAMYLAITVYIAPSSPRLQLAALPAFVALGARLRSEHLMVAWCAGSAIFATALVYVYGLTIVIAP
jgi:hypothetical protein